ncbi:MAG: UPF0489 family protein [Methylophilus sp.]
MDNHKWALYVWESFRQESNIEKFDLVHVDYHWDSIYDFYELAEEESKLLKAGLDELKTMIQTEEFIQYDSFIVPAAMRGAFQDVHFLCRQLDTDIGIEESIREQANIRQFIYNSVDELASVRLNQPIVFDLCLDFFNDSDQFSTGEIWPEQDILEFLAKLHSLICSAELVTISLSFDYSGTEDDTRRLAEIILPKIIEYRSALWKRLY